MFDQNIKSKAFSGVFWKLLERFSNQIVSLIVSLILARILNPTDYGAVAMVTIFVTFADIFVNESIASSLIQKSKVDDIDFSTIFFFNLILSIILYFILYLIAPFIASFYNLPILKPVLRVLALKIPLSGINSVQQAYVTRNFQFKKFFLSTLSGTIISAAIGIIMAYNGYGVWSLVFQYLINVIVNTIVLWNTVKWRPIMAFSFKRLFVLLNFGIGVLFYNLLINTYDQLRSLLIGKFYSSEDLAFYSKGSEIPNIVVLIINTSISTVLFPLLSRMKDDIKEVYFLARKSIRLSSYLISPLLIGLFVVAEPLVKVLLSEKWIGMVPYFKIYCIGMLFRPCNSANVEVMKSQGKSDLLLKMDIIIRIFGVILLLLVVKMGVIYIAFSALIVSVVGAIIYAIPSKKLIGLSITEEIVDVFSGIIPSVIMGIIVYCVSLLTLPTIISLILQIIVGILSYICISVMTKNENYIYLLNIIKNFLKEHSKKVNKL